MESIGERLKKIRLEKGLSLEEANKKTNIHLTILKAIEDDSMINLNPVYIKGFIKIYCKYLGVDPQEFVPDHKPTQNIVPKKMIKEKADNVAAVSVRPAIKLPVRQIAAVAAAVVLLFILFKIGKFIVVKVSKLSSKQRARAVLVTKELARAEAKKPQQGSQQAHVEKIPASSVIRLSIRAKENCFIQVKCDGKTQFYGTLKKGRSDSWKANNKIEFSLGNATAVDVEVNNRLISNLGRRGQAVKNIVVTKDGLSTPR